MSTGLVPNFQIGGHHSIFRPFGAAGHGLSPCGRSPRPRRRAGPSRRRVGCHEPVHVDSPAKDGDDYTTGAAGTAAREPPRRRGCFKTWHGRLAPRSVLRNASHGRPARGTCLSGRQVAGPGRPAQRPADCDARPSPWGPLRGWPCHGCLPRLPCHGCLPRLPCHGCLPRLPAAGTKQIRSPRQETPATSRRG